MNWVAVDLGVSTIKASVLDKSNKPVRLSYSMGDYKTTLLSSVVAVTDDGNVVIGDYASLLGVNNPGVMCPDWLHSSNKALIAKAIFERINKAAIKHYSDTNIGIVLLFGETLDKDLVNIAKTVFTEVQSMSIGEVVKHITSPDSNLILIADFGESAFRVTLQEKFEEKSRSKYSASNASLGFSSIDMFSLIDCDTPSFHDNIEVALLGQMMQRIKILINNGEKVILPNNVSAKENSLAGSFEQKMTIFLYRCFEECSNALKSISKSWDDIEEVVFIGGGAHSRIIDAVFEKYMQSRRTLVSYNSKNREFDAQYAASHCAIQIHELKEVGIEVSVRGGNYIG